MGAAIAINVAVPVQPCFGIIVVQSLKHVKQSSVAQLVWPWHSVDS